MEEKRISPLKAIRQFCIDCCGGQASEVKYCNSQLCKLHDFRFGTDPYRKKREYTPEQLEAARDRLMKARAAKNS